LNRQHITPGRPFQYLGGEIPLVHPAAGYALELAQAAVALLPGLQGYVGVDLLLSGSQAWLIEINPRLTTSYVGLRQVIQLNLAQAIWDACRQARLPARVSLSGRVEFTKEDVASWRLETASRLPSSSTLEDQEVQQ